jgi:hypothetical protein
LDPEEEIRRREEKEHLRRLKEEEERQRTKERMLELETLGGCTVLFGVPMDDDTIWNWNKDKQLWIREEKPLKEEIADEIAWEKLAERKKKFGKVAKKLKA